MEKQLTGQHVHVGAVRDAEDVGWHFVTPLADVHLDHTVGVDGVPLVRVDGHAEETRVSLQHSHRTEQLQINIDHIMLHIILGLFIIVIGNDGFLIFSNLFFP